MWAKERGENTTVIRSSAAPRGQTYRAMNYLGVWIVIKYYKCKVLLMAARWDLQKFDFDDLTTYTHTLQIAVEEDTSMLKHLRWE